VYVKLAIAGIVVLVVVILAALGWLVYQRISEPDHGVVSEQKAP
jgi:hypothetical protein